MKCTAIVLIITAGALLAMALTGCTLTRSSDGVTTAGMQVTAEELLTAWDLYEASRVRAEK